jgi:hypothetical protein
VKKIKQKASFTPHSKTTPLFGLQNYNIHPVQNDVVLTINFFKRKICKKRGRNRGWLFSSHPHGQGGGSATPKRPKKKKKKFWSFGDGRTTSKGLGNNDKKIK